MKYFFTFSSPNNNLWSLFSDKEVFIAADLFWYPVKGNPEIKVAPDVMVAFDRPSGYRGSYKQWKEDDIAPQVVFEVISPSNTILEMLDKLAFFEEYGVSECILLDPKKNEFKAYVAQDGKLIQDNTPGQLWNSPLLGIGFQVKGGELQVLYADGTPLKTFTEIMAEKDAALEEVERLKTRLRELGENP